jgi:HD superfamily phosphohydrolase
MKSKDNHEIRNPINIFSHLSSKERMVLDLPPVQRLRYIHQLALTYQVYPGATHRRFEHSIGVMDLASRIFDVVTDERNHQGTSFELSPGFDKEYWRRVVRIAALLHDIGHPPFSHGPEDLFPDGWNHERMTQEIIESDHLKKVWKELKIQSNDVAALAIGTKSTKKHVFSTTEALLSEIIVGDTFGADRIDYLLRDSLHSGVLYGQFDYYRLIETLRILPKEYDESNEPAIGVELGGLHSAEALLLARYFMFKQLYFHPIRRIYDIHLIDFLKSWLPRGVLPNDVDEYLNLTDNEVLSALRKSAKDTGDPLYEKAQRIVERKHYKALYTLNPVDLQKTLEPGKMIFEAACKEFGPENLRHDAYTQKGNDVHFPVLEPDDRIILSIVRSENLANLPLITIDSVYINPILEQKAKRWLDKNRDKIFESGMGAGEDE